MKHVLVAALALVPAVSAAQTPSNQELCVRLATTILTGEPAEGMAQQDIVNELHARQEPCAPSDLYVNAAHYRLQQAQMEEQQQQARSDRRRRVLINALQQFSNTPTQAPPAPISNQRQSTNCRWVGQNWICDSW